MSLGNSRARSKSLHEYSSLIFFMAIVQSRNTSGVIQGGAGGLYSVLEDPGRGQVRR